MPHRSGVFIVVDGRGQNYLDETGSKFLPMPLLEDKGGRGYRRPDGAWVGEYAAGRVACREARDRLDDAAHLVQLKPGDRRNDR